MLISWIVKKYMLRLKKWLMTAQIFACNTLTVTKKYLSPLALQLLLCWCVFNLRLVPCGEMFSCLCPYVAEFEAQQGQLYLFEERQWRLPDQVNVRAPLQGGCNTSDFSHVIKNFLLNFQLANYVRNKILHGNSVRCNFVPSCFSC